MKTKPEPKTPPSLNVPYRKADKALPVVPTRDSEGRYIRDRVLYTNQGLNRQQRRMFRKQGLG